MSCVTVLVRDTGEVVKGGGSSALDSTRGKGSSHKKTKSLWTKILNEVVDDIDS